MNRLFATFAETVKTNAPVPEFDVIVLDILMLELSGTDFLKEFDTKKHPKTKVVVVSNLDSPNVIERAKELGAIDYLIKSQYTPDQLVESVKSLNN